MRIVAGTLKGRNIDAPSGDDTRPTIDRVREALFSSLYSLRGGFEGAVVLDAFAGSGALGIEALSRGAASATFYESSAKAASVVERNVASCGIADKSRIVRRDILATPPSSHAPFDLVFFDPPYAYDPRMVLGMALPLADGAIIVYEHDIKAADNVASAAEEAGFTFVAGKKYGKTGVTIMKWEQR